MTVTSETPISSEGLDDLLSEFGESLDGIQADPGEAYERLVRRYLTRSPSIEDELGEIESELIALTKARWRRFARPFGHRVVGNVLLGNSRVITQEDLDAMWDRVLSFGR